MSEFTIDPKIMADCHCLGKWKDCWVMLHRSSAVRWLIVVPETDASEWHELPGRIQSQLTRIASDLGAMLKAKLSCDKINTASIGNIVSQFHLHVIGRWKTDPYWPGVVWGRSSVDVQYSQPEVDDIRKQCFDSLEHEVPPDFGSTCCASPTT